jgi:hypothetical protein
MIKYWFLKKLLELSTKFHVLVDECFNWNAKLAKYPIQKCIGNSFIIAILQCMAPILATLKNVQL